MTGGLLLASCGFQLRGAIDLPKEYTPVFIQAGGAVAAELAQQMRDSGIAVTSSPKGAGLVVRLLAERPGSRVAAVDRDGKALAYDLSYSVAFDALDAKGKVVIPPNSIVASRTFDDNPNVAVLGSELESQMIYQDLVADTAYRILLVLRARLVFGASSQPQPAGASSSPPQARSP